MDATWRNVTSGVIPFTAGTIAVGVALAYTEFRKVAPDWRQGRPRLTAWFAGFEARPSMRATVPRE